MKSSITKSIKSLPPLPKTIVDINNVFADISAGVGDLARAIQPDPMIVANLLKNANSPLYGFGKEINTVMQAVSLFGMSLTRSIILGNSVRKLLHVSMKPYGLTSDQFANISSLQATLIYKWYSKIKPKDADKLHLAAFLQETGKILISSDVLQEDKATSFSLEIKETANITQVEKSYVGASSAEVTAEIFMFWGFDKEFIEMIRYSDNPAAAPSEMQEFAMALHVVKTIVCMNKPFNEESINLGLRKARDAGYNHEILEDIVDHMLDIIEAGGISL